MNWVYSLQYLFLSPFIIWAGLYLEFESIFSFFSVLFWPLETTSETRHFVYLSCLCSWVPGVKHIERKSCKAFKIDKIKFETNSHAILDVFPPVFLSRIIYIATSHSSGIMVNTTFPVMNKAIWGFKPSLNLYIKIVLN